MELNFDGKDVTENESFNYERGTSFNSTSFMSNDISDHEMDSVSLQDPTNNETTDKMPTRIPSPSPRGIESMGHCSPFKLPNPSTTIDNLLVEDVTASFDDADMDTSDVPCDYKEMHNETFHSNNQDPSKADDPNPNMSIQTDNLLNLPFNDFLAKPFFNNPINDFINDGAHGNEGASPIHDTPDFVKLNPSSNVIQENGKLKMSTFTELPTTMTREPVMTNNSIGSKKGFIGDQFNDAESTGSCLRGIGLKEVNSTSNYGKSAFHPIMKRSNSASKNKNRARLNNAKNSGNGSTKKMSEEELKRIRRVKNRASVEKCRTKQRLRMEALQDERKTLQVENKALEGLTEWMDSKLMVISSEIASLE